MFKLSKMKENLITWLVAECKCSPNPPFLSNIYNALPASVRSESDNIIVTEFWMNTENNIVRMAIKRNYEYFIEYELFSGKATQLSREDFYNEDII